MSYIKYPETVEFYKKRNTLQMKLKKPVSDDAGKITDNGCVFFEVANAIPGDPDGKIDWSTKIIMKIGVNDIAKILSFIPKEGEECKIFHKTANATTSINLKLGTNPGTYAFNVGKTVGDQKTYVNLYLDSGDMTIMRELLRAALPTMLGWN